MGRSNRGIRREIKRQERNRVIFRAWLDGAPMTELATLHKLSCCRISQICQEMQAVLYDECLKEQKRAKLQQQQRLEEIYKRAIKQFEESCLPDVQLISTGLAGEAAKQKQKTVQKKNTGDPRYLSEARACLKDMRDLWGLSALQAQDMLVTQGQIPAESLSDEELYAIIQASGEKTRAG